MNNPLTRGLRPDGKSWLPKSLTIRTRAPLRWLDGFFLLWACFVSSWQRSFVWQVDRPDLGLYLPCGIGCAAALSAAFGRPVWLWLSFFSSWSGRLQSSSALECTSIE